MSKSMVDSLTGLLRTTPSYEPIDEDAPQDARRQPAYSRRPTKGSFSAVEYGIFFLIGIAMLWAWNMFLAAAPYLQYRFRYSKPILSSFQATELTASTVASLCSMLVLARLQANASYPRRIMLSLLINVATFSLLALSTKLLLNVSAGIYFAFIVVMVVCSSLATSLMQNGSFSYVVRFERSEYMQAIMFGQGVAGVLPPIVQMVTVLSAASGSSMGEKSQQGDSLSSQDAPGQQTSSSALYYFLTAVGVSALALVAFLYLALYHSQQPSTSPKTRIAASEQDGVSDSDEDQDEPLAQSRASLDDAPRDQVPLRVLGRKLLLPASAVFFTFAVTMVFPVFTSLIVSTNSHPPPFLQDASFIPLALLVWNAGDLLGRLLPLVPRISLANRPKILLLLALARIVFVPLYLLCNIQPASAEARHSRAGFVMPDFLYLAIVQLPFGLSNGFLGTCCMTGYGACVAEGEREAAGGFMALALVAGLAFGSVCSFFISIPGS